LKVDFQDSIIIITPVIAHSFFDGWTLPVGRFRKMYTGRGGSFGVTNVMYNSDQVKV